MAKTSDSKSLLIYPLGGVGEIGRNAMVWEYGDWRLLIDCGVNFPDSELHPGVQYLLPDWTALLENPFPHQAVVLTHGHDDHIGALPFFLEEIPVPVYGTPYTLSLVRAKLNGKTPPGASFHPIRSGVPFTLGPFTVEPVHVNHSIPQVVALAIHTPVGTVLHVTDWKIDRTPIGEAVIEEEKFRALGEHGVKLLFGDSTNAERPGHTKSEQAIGQSLHQIAETIPGRLFVTLFASNGMRLKQIIEIARTCDRKIALCGLAVDRNASILRELGMLSASTGDLVSLEAALDLPDSKVLFVLTGSQAEPRSILYRMASGAHPLLRTQPGDTFIFSSKIIPGNERAIGRMIDALCRNGAKVIYEEIAFVHASGHAKSDELGSLIEWTNPEHFVPIHGEYRHLVRHAEIAESKGVDKDRIFVIENGQTLIVSQAGVSLGEKRDAFPRFVNGNGLGYLDRDVLRERRHLSRSGVLTCTLVRNAKTGAILAGPEIDARGLGSPEELESILNRAETHVDKLLHSPDNHALRGASREAVEDAIDLALRQFFNKFLDDKPLIIPLVVEV